MTTLTLNEYRRTALAAMLMALFIAVGMLLVFVPNVELITTTAFLIGFLLGPRWGWWTAGLAEMIFSAINPIGSGLAFPILYGFQVIAIIIVAMIGGIFHKHSVGQAQSWQFRVGLGLLGGIMALVYDFLTAFSFPLTAGLGGWPLLTAAVLGLGFFVVHIAVNVVIFATVVSPLMFLGQRQLQLHGFA